MRLKMISSLCRHIWAQGKLCLIILWFTSNASQFYREIIFSYFLMFLINSCPFWLSNANIYVSRRFFLLMLINLKTIQPVVKFAEFDSNPGTLGSISISSLLFSRKYDSLRRTALARLPYLYWRGKGERRIVEISAWPALISGEGIRRCPNVLIEFSFRPARCFF